MSFASNVKAELCRLAVHEKMLRRGGMLWNFIIWQYLQRDAD